MVISTESIPFLQILQDFKLNLHVIFLNIIHPDGILQGFSKNEWYKIDNNHHIKERKQLECPLSPYSFLVAADRRYLLKPLEMDEINGNSVSNKKNQVILYSDHKFL